MTNEPLASDRAPTIQVADVSFEWTPTTPVLKSCSLAVQPGEFCMLLGDNGSGKSTLLKLLTGLLTAQQGQVKINGTFGYVFQNPDHQLVMPTVGADVAFGLVAEKLPLPTVRGRVSEALAAVNLAHLARRPIYALSGGQKQRVAIAGAIARHCEVLLLDEPTALLDPDSQIELVKLVQRLVKERHLTALWVTHRLIELDYCDRAILLRDGHVVTEGEPNRLRKLLET
ncbi:MAG: energy-coupling factor ABC transporter ATP-binding protein [Cyanobacteria bacterium P01_H01_bin.152]